MGICATSRSFGLAVVVDGVVADLVPRRLSNPRGPRTLARLVEGKLRDHRPAVVVVVGSELLRRHIGEVLAGRAVVEVAEAQIAAALGVTPTRAAICRELAMRCPMIARRVRFTRGVQSDGTRYNEAALVAAGAALALFAEFSRP
jgi:hypothetical protein